VLTALALRAGGRYVDATFGGGGYATAWLEAAPCEVWGIDRDASAIAAAADLCRRFGGRLRLLHGSFAELDRLLAAVDVVEVDGVAFDLGMSSWQLDAAERGFSFRSDGPLDMRMDQSRGQTAADVVRTLPEAELARVLKAYGEERAARRVARAIVAVRARTPITRTGQLAAVVHTVLPGHATIDTATRTFQALRILVNGEIDALDRGLEAAERVLRPGGRLCVVSYHSLEDRVVKRFLRARSGGMPRPSRHLPDPATTPPPPSFRLVGRNAVRPSPEEIAANPRARSARLRIAERTAEPPWSDPHDLRRAA
jgi:16S rRNA (cytosine1402-N4)-methyltransferase